MIDVLPSEATCILFRIKSLGQSVDRRKVRHALICIYYMFVLYDIWFEFKI